MLDYSSGKMFVARCAPVLVNHQWRYRCIRYNVSKWIQSAVFSIILRIWKNDEHVNWRVARLQFGQKFLHSQTATVQSVEKRTKLPLWPPFRMRIKRKISLRKSIPQKSYSPNLSSFDEIAVWAISTVDSAMRPDYCWSGCEHRCSVNSQIESDPLKLFLEDAYTCKRLAFQTNHLAKRGVLGESSLGIV